MQFLDLTLPTPQQNLALDEALLLAAEAGFTTDCLRLWESTGLFVVLGKNCRVLDDVWIERCQAEGIGMLRRSSGGGTVLQGPGCLNFSVVLRYDSAPGLNAVQPSIAYVLEQVRRAIGGFDPRVAMVATSDLAIDHRKFCGSAQRRLRTHFLHHGSILNHFDLAAVPRYLKEPRRLPAYRAGRDHMSFLMNLNADPLSLRDRLRVVWGATELLQTWPQEIVRDLVQSKYGNPGWNYRL